MEVEVERRENAGRGRRRGDERERVSERVSEGSP